MPNRDPKMLEHLRGLFREELEDQIKLINSQVTTLLDENREPATRQAALQESYRAVHSLKGAAGAVGFPEPERICHELEDALGTARHQDTEPEFATLAQQLQAAVAALTEWAHANAMHDSVAPPPPSSLPGREAHASNSTRAAEAQAAGTIRVRISALDTVLASVTDWHADYSTAPPTQTQVQAVIDLLTDFFTEEHELDSPIKRTRYLQAARRMLTELRQRYGYELSERRTARRAQALHMGDIVRQLRNLRLQPFHQISAVLEQAVIEATRVEGKQVEFELTGGDAEADYRVIERLREPLLHLVRNAAAHGIETPLERQTAGKPKHGTVRVAVQARGAELHVSVEDDGRGIALESLKQAAREQGVQVPDAFNDAALLNLLCTVGLSTREHADHHAGRGVGMDLVKDRIERLQGRIRVSSTPGQGTSVVLDVPVDLALLEVLVFGLGNEVFALPTSHVRQLRRITANDLTLVDGIPFVFDGNDLIRVSDFRMVVVEGAELELDKESTRACVVLEASGTLAAFIADDLLSVGEHVVKPLSERARVPLSQAALVMPEGRVVPLLNVNELCARATASTAQWVVANDGGEPAKARVLIVDDSVTTRQLVRILLEAAGYLVESVANGEQAWAQLRSKTRFDAIVSDIEMPRMNGMELLAKVRASTRLRDLPVILVTALAQDADRRQALDLGADAYLVKSRFDQQTLLDTLKDLLG